jgi:hypothetical protein
MDEKGERPGDNDQGDRFNKMLLIHGIPHLADFPTKIDLPQMSRRNNCDHFCEKKHRIPSRLSSKRAANKQIRSIVGRSCICAQIVWLSMPLIVRDDGCYANESDACAVRSITERKGRLVLLPRRRLSALTATIGTRITITIACD